MFLTGPQNNWILMLPEFEKRLGRKVNAESRMSDNVFILQGDITKAENSMDLVRLR